MADWFEESHWLASENPHHLMHILERQGIRSGRKARLTAVSACRRVLGPLSPALENVLAAAESYADRQASFDAMRAAAEAVAPTGTRDQVLTAVHATAHRDAHIGLTQTLYRLLDCAWGGPHLPAEQPSTWEGDSWGGTCRSVAALVRDVYGNPFAHVPASAIPRTPQLVALARAAYDRPNLRAWPALVAGMRAAHCSYLPALTHFRGATPHVRGCWVLDTILRKR